MHGSHYTLDHRVSGDLEVSAHRNDVIINQHVNQNIYCTHMFSSTPKTLQFEKCIFRNRSDDELGASEATVRLIKQLGGIVNDE